MHFANILFKFSLLDFFLALMVGQYAENMEKLMGTLISVRNFLLPKLLSTIPACRITESNAAPTILACVMGYA